jgi:hypothetical protein
MTTLFDMAYSIGTEVFKNTAGLCWNLLFPVLNEVFAWTFSFPLTLGIPGL